MFSNTNHRAGIFLFRACLKNALRKMCVTICGRFCSDEGVVVGYDNRIRTKYTAKWGVQIAGMIFQTRSSTYYFTEICSLDLSAISFLIFSTNSSSGRTLVSFSPWRRKETLRLSFSLNPITSR